MRFELVDKSTYNLPTIQIVLHFYLDKCSAAILGALQTIYRVFEDDGLGGCYTNNIHCLEEAVGVGFWSLDIVTSDNTIYTIRKVKVSHHVGDIVNVTCRYYPYLCA